jgi:hypothetical protein
VHAYRPSLMRATFPSHFILLHSILRIAFGDEWQPWSSSLCIFLQFPFFSSLLDRKYLLQNPIFQNPQPIYLPHCERSSFTLHWSEVLVVTSVPLFSYGGSKISLIC